ncbi:hypothetical protein MUP79_10110 [Candidatus Bathyarchaeota archaeon]|nr:hypothetical protein [Candidatus Bathyarchaeota archaeon]
MPSHGIKWPIGDRDIELLSYLSQHDIKDAAQKFKKTPGALNSELYRIRARIARVEAYLKAIRHLRHISNRVNKLTSSAKIEKLRLNQEEDDDVDGPR